MRVARTLVHLLPWALVVLQGWLVDRLLKRHGQALLVQERLRDRLARLERWQAGPVVGALEPSEVERFRDGQYARYHHLQDQALAAVPPYPAERFAGAGIVILAGGPRHYTNAWVGLTMLRRVLGCRLPIQVWYLGPHEMSPRMIELLEPFDVVCVNVLGVQRQHPARLAGPWECKPYAMLHSPFKEVILLDADNLPLIDPAALLTRPEYRATGALFWPDLQDLGRENPIWEICRVPYRAEPEFESGQIVIDKERCWQALQLTLHLNEQSEFYYQQVHGDKETFHLAWRMLDQPFAMPPFRPTWLTGLINPGDSHLADVLQQHDFDGRIIFHHRTGAKWTAWGENFQAPGFAHQEVCLEALRELRQRWDGRVDTAEAVANAPTAEAELLRTRYFLYRRSGLDERVLSFLPGQRIGEGGSRWEQTWRLEAGAAHPTLVIAGYDGSTCRLVRDPDGVWRGRWLHHQRSPVELLPLGNASPE